MLHCTFCVLYELLAKKQNIMKRLFSKSIIMAFVACCVVASYSCNRKPVPSSKADEVASAVCKMYDYVFECYRAGNDSLDVFNRRYLTADYNKMIDSVRAFDSIHHAEECGFFEYDHWIMGQDWDKPTYTLDTVFVSDSLVDWYWATVTINNFGTTQVHLLMVPEDGEWKIGDMLDYDLNLDKPSEMDNMSLYLRDAR